MYSDSVCGLDTHIIKHPVYIFTWPVCNYVVLTFSEAIGFCQFPLKLALSETLKFDILGIQNKSVICDSYKILDQFFDCTVMRRSWVPGEYTKMTSGVHSVGACALLEKVKPPILLTVVDELVNIWGSVIALENISYGGRLNWVMMFCNIISLENWIRLSRRCSTLTLR